MYFLIFPVFPACQKCKGNTKTPSNATFLSAEGEKKNQKVHSIKQMFLELSE